MEEHSWRATANSENNYSRAVGRSATPRPWRHLSPQGPCAGVAIDRTASALGRATDPTPRPGATASSRLAGRDRTVTDLFCHWSWAVIRQLLTASNSWRKGLADHRHPSPDRSRGGIEASSGAAAGFTGRKLQHPGHCPGEPMKQVIAMHGWAGSPCTWRHWQDVFEAKGWTWCSTCQPRLRRIHS